MKIVQINCVYGDGSTGVLVRQLHQYLQSRGWESLVLYGRGADTAEVGVLRTGPEWYGKGNALVSRFTGLPYGGCLLATEKLLRILEGERPDVVHLHCVNGNFVNVYRIANWLKKKKIRTVVTLHAEFLFTGACAHSLDCEGWKTGCGACPRFPYDTARSYRKMAEAFRGFGDGLTVVSPSPWLRRRAELAPILREGQHRTIFNGVDTGIFWDTPCGKSGDGKIIFHATALFRDDPEHLKGGWYVLELARRMRGQPVRFLVAGKHKIRGEIPENVTLLGEIRDAGKLTQLYCAADVTLLTSRRETFSMVCAESLCCGTPVVGFEAGGPESIALPAYSRFVPWGNLDALQAAVEEELTTTRDRADISRKGGAAYSLEKMLRAYEQVYLGG